jgi:NAD(P)H-dependent FMN reductase
MPFLILSTSLNPESRSRLMARASLAAFCERGLSAELKDLRDFPLPLCDGGTAYGDPNVAKIGGLIAAAEGLVVATPVYNYDANAALKNLVELTGKSWENKAVAFLCAAGGDSSYMSIMSLANSLMLDFRCVIVPRFVYATDEAFGGDTITDAAITERIGRQAADLQALAGAYPPR